MSNKKILVVDDEKECCELIKEYFAKSNYIVDMFCDGKKALESLVQGVYEYIIFDYSMPGFSGADLARAMKEREIKAKKILISGYDLLNDDMIKGMEVDAFLRKPFVLSDLRAIIQES